MTVEEVFMWGVIGGLTLLVYQKVGVNINELAALHLGAATL
ncbi:hypothetical protein OUO06_20010 (plasmid) [Photobacterium damselae]